MSTEPQLFRINPDTRESKSITEVEFAQLGFQERRHIQEWIAANPEILGDDLLIIAKEFGGFDKTNERLDLLAVDSDGILVVIELKRDDTGSDVHWQAIKYASYLRQTSPDRIISIFASYKEIKDTDAADLLQDHFEADDLSALNNDQRIILASHRFAPEVTSAVVWLNEKAPGENLITCIQLTPFQDQESLYVQSNTIIPAPGVDTIEVGAPSSHIQSRVNRTKRPRLKFSALGIPIGAELVFTRKDKRAQVIDGGTNVKYKGVTWTLTKLTKHLLGSSRGVSSQPYWTYQGKLLQEIYNDAYGPKQEPIQ